MGESSRKRRERAAQDATPVTCLYGQGPAIYTLVPDPSTVHEDALWLADLVRAPNAMRPSGTAGFEPGQADRVAGELAARLAAAEGGVCGFLISGEPARTFSFQERPPEDLLPMDMGFVILAWAPAEHEAEVRITSTLAGGLTRHDGTPVADVPAEMAGLVRLDALGRPIVAADAPLTVQYAVLCRAMLAASAEWNGSEGEKATGSAEAVARSIADHVMQVTTIAKPYFGTAGVDPCAWIDAGIFFETARDSPVGDHVDPAEALAELAVALDDALPDAPRWKLAGMGHFEQWVPRDEPGAGRIWVGEDAAIARAFPAAPSSPGPSAELLAVPPNRRIEARALVAQASAVARNGRNVLAHDPGRGLYLCLLDDAEEPVLVAWPAVDASGPRRDPLMSELLAGSDEWEDMPGRPEGEASDDIYEALASTGLLAALPQPDLTQDYAFLALAHAHRRNLRVPDLLASLAKVVREGGADASFRADPDAEEDSDADIDGNPADGGDLERPLDGEGLSSDERAACDAVVSAAESLGGRPDPLLVAMFAGMDAEDWFGIDLDRDVRLIRDAFGRGCALSDVALVTLGTMMEAWDRPE